NMVAGKSVCVAIDGTSPFTGQMDEIDIFNRALSADEIAAIYHAGSAGKCQQTSPACLAPPSGLVSWWPGNGNGTDVVGGNNATVMNGISFTSGEVGQAFGFNGIDSQISFGNTIGNFGTNDFTIDFWIKTTGTNHQSLIEKWPTCGFSSEWYTRLRSSGQLEAEMTSDSQGSDRTVLVSGRAVNDGTVHHVAFVRRGRNLACFIDGVLDASSDSAGGITRLDNSADLTVGRSVCVGSDGTSPL